ncbi:conserved protein of unknown function [Rhodovastum atsumiense]|uniref:Uncharacterized protein n=1 Tax=Rhodovastum atsumiense TaxID=504468 RepID=A0A5M6J1J8_9PROT|nr:hypothetical protein [Rhodovastum atsumiense]KAA5613505.1 hypothetical protein F1189_05465 [Rhodovastum atsumiense]CAH2603252.1 conserved protein of unknown function [Rhodovastum atsumiense]
MTTTPPTGLRSFENERPSRTASEKTGAVEPQSHAPTDKQAHRAELEKTRALGPQPTVASGELVPPLPLSDAELMAEAGRACTRQEDGFVPIQTEAVDGRAPWQAESLKGSAAALASGGFVVIRPAGGPEGGWETVLLTNEGPDGISSHVLLSRRSRRAMNFVTRPETETALRPVLAAGGELPDEWCWSSPLHDPDET